MRPSNSAKAGISIQIRQCVANHFVGVLITELASIPLSVFNPLTLLCCSFLLLYSASIFWYVLCLSASLCIGVDFRRSCERNLGRNLCEC
jgi:hypothetical protein